MNTQSNMVAQGNMASLCSNPYPGRGIVIGMAYGGTFAVQVYWIMGRSDNSRNRVLSVDGGRLFTEAADPATMKDPSLIIYNAMQEENGVFAVSNGKQTDDVKHCCCDSELAAALSEYQYEPDVPNFTPRITGICSLCGDEPLFMLSVLRKAQRVDAVDTCDRFLYTYRKIDAGFGYCVTTYLGDGNPLPSFTGEPRLMPLDGPMDFVARTYWEALNPDNRVALAVKFTPVSGGKSTIAVINKLTKVGG